MSANVDLIGLLELGSVLVYEEENTHGTCPISLSQAGACERGVAIKAKTAQKRRVDGTGARIFQNGTDRGKRNARALELAVKARGQDLEVSIVGVEMEHWMHVHTCLATEAEEIVLRLAQIHGPKLSIRMRATAGPLASIEVLGHSDVVLRVGNTLHVVDFKTMNQWALKKINAEDYRTAQEASLIQIACYTECLKDVRNWPLGDSRNPLVGDACLIFEDSNDKDYVGPVWLPVDAMGEYVEKGRRNLTAALNSVLSGKLPDRPFGPDEKGKLSWRCNYCDVASECWGDLIYNAEPSKRIPSWVVH